MAKQPKRTKEEINKTLYNNARLGIKLGFAIDNYSISVNKWCKAKSKLQYSRCDFRKDFILVNDHYEERCKTPKQTIVSSHFGKEPVFDQFRDFKHYETRKRGNTIALIRHPDEWAFDFDVHDDSPAKAKLLQEIFVRLYQYPELLVGYSENFKGLHVFCTTPYKWIVEQEVELFKQIEGHVDIFNHTIKNAIGIPGYDHYCYKEQDVLRFMNLLDVKIFGRISIYQSRDEQHIKYPKSMPFPEEILKRIKPYKDAAANIKLHLKGIKNRIICNNHVDISNDVEYIKTLMADEGNRTPFLLSKKGHILITRYLSNAHIEDIEIFKTQFPDFEENHYQLIEQMIEHIKVPYDNTHKKYTSKNTDYVKEVKELRISIEQWFQDNNITFNSNFLSVTTYLANCKKHKISSPGYDHYIEFCKMNEEEPVPRSTYFDQIKKCIDCKWIYIPNNSFYMVGKKCREVEEGSLLKAFIEYAFKLIVHKYNKTKKETNKLFNYIEVNNIYNIDIYNIKKIPSLSIILCSPKNTNMDILDIFDMKDFYSLRL